MLVCFGKWTGQFAVVPNQYHPATEIKNMKKFLLRLNESPMKTSVNTGEASLPPAQTADCGVEPPVQQCDGSEKQGFGVAKSLQSQVMGV